jgi:hypothetical protein
MGGAAHLKIVLIASLAGILFGFDTAVIAGATHALRDIFSLSPAGLGAARCSAHSSWAAPAIDTEAVTYCESSACCT